MYMRLARTPGYLLYNWYWSDVISPSKQSIELQYSSRPSSPTYMYDATHNFILKPVVFAQIHPMQPLLK